MKARYEQLLQMIAVGERDASDYVAFNAVVKEAQLLGVVTKIEIHGVRAMAGVAESVGPKSPAIHPPVYRYIKKRTQEKLAHILRD